MKILLTTTSFQDTPGKHHELLESQNWEVETLRGPLKEEILLPIVGNYDGIICGDDEITERVIIEGKKGKLKAISKYGIGLDKIDLEVARKFNIPIANTPGVNHVTVAEHVLALLLCYYKNIHLEYNITQENKWKRLIGHEIYRKKIGIFGLGRIGKELAIRAKVLGMDVYATDIYKDENFVSENKINWVNNIEEMIKYIDILSINSPLTNETRGIIENKIFNKCRNELVIVNTARAEIVNLNHLVFALQNKQICAYLTDVLEEEPIKENHPLLKFDNVIITPHIGSRTFESVERQGIKAVENLIGLFGK